MTPPRLDLLLVLVAATAAAGCGGPRYLERTGVVEGEAILSEGLRGDVYLFLSGQAEGPPGGQGAPRYATAIPDGRLGRGDRRFVFGGVAPNPYRLQAFLDSDRDFTPEVEVLAQPGAFDRRGRAVALNLQPGQRLEVAVTLDELVRWEPPAFLVLGAPPVTVLPDRPTSAVTLELRSHPQHGFDPAHSGLVVSLSDANGDGRPDDSDGDGIPDLHPRVFLRYLPRSGQWRPVNQRGEPGEVIVPLVFNPGPFLAGLAGDVRREIVVRQLVVLYLPLAQAITDEPGPGTVVTPLAAVPPGEYELWIVSREGQFWKLPNALGSPGETPRAGPRPVASQAARFEIVRSDAPRP